MKKNTLLLVTAIDCKLKLILFYFTIFLMFLFVHKGYSQCGPYQYYTGGNQTKMVGDGWVTSGGTWAYPINLYTARSGGQAVTQSNKLLSTPTYIQSPKINTPKTFSFWIKGTAALNYSFSFSDDNGTTWTPIVNGVTTLSTTLNPTPYAVSSATVPVLSTSWQLVTVTANFPVSPYGYYFKLNDTRVNGTFGTLCLDDFSWVSSVATDNTIVVPAVTSSVYTPTNCSVSVPTTAIYHFYDVGGSDDNFSNGQANILTFTPVDPTFKIKVTFIAPNFNLNGARVFVYDNTATTGNAILGSPFSATPLVTPYVSSLSSDGSITLEFISNGTYASSSILGQAGGYDIQVECSSPVCQLPTSAPTISTITSTTATIKWTGISPGYEYATTLTNSPPSASGTYTTSTTGVVSGLIPETFYYVWVRGNCGSSFYSDWVMSSGFTTLCPPNAVPYLEDFSGLNVALPHCTSSTGGDWQTNLSMGNLQATVAGNFFFTKPLTLSSATNYTLSYDYAALLGTANFDVYIGKVNDASIMIPANKLFSHIGISTAATNSFTFTIPTAGVYYIGFYLTSTSTPSTTQLTLDTISVDCVTPIITASTSIICSPNTIVTLTGSGVSGYTWATSAGTLYFNTAATFLYTSTLNRSTVYLRTNSNSTITLTSINGACSKTSTINIVVKGTTWDGTSWSSGVPDSTTQAVFNGNYTSTADLNACSVIVNNGAVLFKAGTSLIVQNAVNVAGGSLTFENNSSLVQMNDVTNATGVYNGGNVGNIIYQRDTNPMRLYDFTYWSSPVYPQTLVGLSPLTLSDKYLYFNAATSSWLSMASNSLMNIGKGYIIRAPQTFSATSAQVYHASFMGIPNSGTITTPIVGPGNLNLIGNPYPSALNIDLFMASPLNTAIVDKTIYLWTHNTAITNNNYSNNDYAVYNYLGGTGTSSAPSGATGGFNTNVPTGKIAAGESFFIKGLAAGNASFQNSMRVVGNNNQFYKNTNSNPSSSTEMNRIWLDISNNQGDYKQTLIGYTKNATLGMDKGYDGDYFSFGSPISLYSLVDVNPLAIQGRPMPFDVSDEVPLGFNTITTGTFTINLYDFDGLFTHQDIYLKDKYLNTVVNLKQGAYSFTANGGTYNDRFVLVYKYSTITTNISSFNENAIVLYKPNQNLIIDSGATIMKTVKVYDVRGALILEKEGINENKTSLNIGTMHQVLLIEITSYEGEVVSRKYVN